MKKLTIIILATLMLFAVGLSVYAFLPQRQIMFGAWTEGFFDAKTRTLHPEKLLEFEQRVGKKASIAHYYRGWEYLPDPILISEFATLKSNNW